MSQLIDLKNFIQSTRDSGYKNVHRAISEVIDNAIEAGATTISICIEKIDDEFIIWIFDNGLGMDIKELQLALKFGGSTRFNSRESYGRYGMGLPNSSLSIARRVEVYSWQNNRKPLWTYLDIDEIISGAYKRLRKPKPKNINYTEGSPSGTVVVWKNIDRLGYKSLKPLTSFLIRKLGQTYRHYLYNGFKIIINDETLLPFDPLFIMDGQNLVGAKLFAEDLVIEMKVPNKNITKNITFRFSILPIKEWSALSNIEKRRKFITKNSGISILRNGREIDYGWFFMGTKRRENYDDWWRAEIAFPADLDELFGVTHTKQFINPTAELREILTPHVEYAARSLHRQVIDSFIKLKKGEIISDALKIAEQKDPLLSTLQRKRTKNKPIPESSRKINGMAYQLYFRDSTDPFLFDPVLKNRTIHTTINSNHAFYRFIDHELKDQSKLVNSLVNKMFELLVLAAARAELALSKASSEIKGFRLEWGRVLTKFFT